MRVITGVKPTAVAQRPFTPMCVWSVHDESQMNKKKIEIFKRNENLRSSGSSNKIKERKGDMTCRKVKKKDDNLLLQQRAVLEISMKRRERRDVIAKNNLVFSSSSYFINDAQFLISHCESSTNVSTSFSTILYNCTIYFVKLIATPSMRKPSVGKQKTTKTHFTRSTSLLSLSARQNKKGLK